MSKYPINTVRDDCEGGEWFLNEKQLAARWGIERKTIQKFRYQGGGPRFHKIGGSVRYAISDVLSFEETCKRESTSQETRDKTEIEDSKD